MGAAAPAFLGTRMWFPPTVNSAWLRVMRVTVGRVFGGTMASRMISPCPSSAAFSGR